MIQDKSTQEKIMAECFPKGTEFKFIPPRAPHFGGLWEAAVKSAKHFLQRTVASASLTYEELETVVVEIEAIMNSRPITSMSANPNELTALTPAHLLIGEPLTANVDPHAQPLNVKLPTRWKLVSHLKNEFWRRWSHEYLNQLQQRYKWKERCENVKPGTIVIIKDDNLPPMKWPLGRILQVINGQDGLARVAKIQTSTSIINRPIHRLAPLPTEDEGNTLPSDNSTATQHVLQDKKDTDSEAEQGSSNNTTSTPRKRSRLSMGAAMVTLLLTCLVLPITHAHEIDISYFKPNTGIYFENLGSANIITSEWNLIAYHDLKGYWMDLEKLQNCTHILQQTCLLMHNSRHCSRISDQIKLIVEQLHYNNDLLRTNHAHRSRRGALNIVGNIANALFGVLDSEYAKQMSSTITKIQQNEEHISTLVHNQTSFLDATINLIQQEHQSVQNEFRHIEEFFNKTTLQLKIVEAELYEDRAAQAFTFITIQTMLAILNYQRMQDNILNILIDSHQGKINTMLVSPKQLENELLIIKGNLPTSLKLPMPISDILKFYNIMSIEGRVTTNHIIFKLKIPLLSTEGFELFKLIPVPVKINQTFAAIKPSFPFLIVNLHRDQYQPMTEQELQQCTSIDTDNHICPQRRPLYRKGSAVSACEISLLNNITTNSACSVVTMNNEPYWAQLQNSNQWLFSVGEPVTLNVVCGDKSFQINIHDEGILKTNDDCIIKQPAITIQGHHIYSTINRRPYIPSTNISNIIVAQNIDSPLKYTNSYFPHLQELQTIRQELSSVKTQLPNNMPLHQIHHYTLGYVSLLIVSCILIYLVWSAKRKNCNKPSTSDQVTSSDETNNKGQDSDPPEIVKVFK